MHVVCNNAGVAGGSVIDSPIEMWQWVLGVNLWGVIHGCNVFLPDLLEQDDGHIVNTASIAGLGGAAGLGVYCTSKFAVVGLSESLHHDLAARDSHVGVSVLCPGFVNTRIFESDRNMPDDVRAALDAPDGRQRGRADGGRVRHPAHGRGGCGVRGDHRQPVLRAAPRTRRGPVGREPSRLDAGRRTRSVRHRVADPALEVRGQTESRSAVARGT